MFKSFYSLLILIFFISSCKSDIKTNSKTSDSSISYTVTIAISDCNTKLAFIQNLNNPKQIDTTEIKSNTAIFKGTIEEPERYVLTIQDVFGGKMFVLENDSIHIKIKNKDLMNATISNSEINNELLSIQKSSEEIYNQIDLLFPDLQRARLENDAHKLSEISKKMSLIEKENLEFNFKYANNHPKSYIAAMILHDLSKRDSIDSDRIKMIYNNLSQNVKKNSDAISVSNYLQELH